MSSVPNDPAIHHSPCSTCGATGFGLSLLGPHRCQFCDGTENGVHVTLEEQIAAWGTGSIPAAIQRFGRDVEAMHVGAQVVRVTLGEVAWELFLKQLPDDERPAPYFNKTNYGGVSVRVDRWSR